MILYRLVFLLILLPALIALLVLLWFHDSHLAAGSFWITFGLMGLYVLQPRSERGGGQR